MINKYIEAFYYSMLDDTHYIIEIDKEYLKAFKQGMGGNFIEWLIGKINE